MNQGNARIAGASAFRVGFLAKVGSLESYGPSAYHLSRLQTSKFSMTSFYVTSFICSSVRATLTIFSMTSALVQKLAC